VGGIKEKVLAAIAPGSKTILLPIDNKKDLERFRPMSNGGWSLSCGTHG
jgi:ATP-dependent Lon protease